MKRILFLLLVLSFLRAEEGLVNSSYVENVLTKDAYWSTLHGASSRDLGSGIIYYALVYANKAKSCVCLGSGDGFVPRMIRQAQRDLNLPNAETTLIDGNTGRWGRPKWLHKDAFFRKAFPEIAIILKTTQAAADLFREKQPIDYLHIDAERTVQGALNDFLLYLPFMAKNSIITLHDTGANQPCAYTVERIKAMGYSVINLETLGTGLALIYIP